MGGAVNVYALDSYPGGLSCTNVNTGFNIVRTYYQWFQNYSYTQPEYLAEFEAGYFTPWGGSFYDDCAAEHDPAFADVYFKNNIGQRTTLMSLYMAWGGTNWGHCQYLRLCGKPLLTGCSRCSCRLHLIRLLCTSPRDSTDPRQVLPNQAH